MVSLELADELEISAGDRIEVLDEVDWDRPDARRALAPVPGGADNLVARALAAVGRRADVRLRKRIPHGGGLGGGSSDAAAILRWAGRTEADLAVALGADVPFCVQGGRAMVTGIGEVIEPLDAEPLAFVLVTPDIAVSTAAVYAAFDELGAGDRSLEHNDLERAAVAVAPELVRVRDVVSEAAGIRAQIAGSGSTFFVECAAEDLDALAADVAAAARAALRCACVSATRASSPSFGAT